MIPKFLSKYQASLENYKMETISIVATPIKKKDKLSLTESKFSGIPYLPKSIDYPKDKNGIPMILLAQINFAEAPPIQDYPSDGILQFFVSSTDWYDTEDDSYKILYHKSLDEDPQTDFSFLTDSLYEDSPVDCIHKLSFSKEIGYGGYEDCRFEMTFDSKDSYDFQDSLSESEIEKMDKILDGTGHKIGGYAYFTQRDPRTNDDSPEKDVLLLQIDSDDKIMFGDSGVGVLLISPQDLKDKNFDQAWFYWDCC